LGLYIVRQIVHAHNGTISVRDNKPQGSIFEVRFPAKSEWITTETTQALDPVG
jgi:signal transduction histidine kinase